jgi:hypothetical protein
VTRRDGSQVAFTGLSENELRVVLCVHLLAFVLDGDLGASEMELWEAVCRAAGPETAVFDPAAVKSLCVHFRGLMPIAVTDLVAVFDPSKVRTGENQKVPFNVQLREFFHDAEACLAV